MNFWHNRRWHWLILIFVCIWLAALYTQRTNLTASDLGRHLMNGQVILETGSVFTTNFYSHTHPEFSVPNHHWLFGVFAYGIYQAGGFALLSLTGMVISMTSVLILVWCQVRKNARLILPIAGALFVLLPVLAHRAEVRPEAISLVFFSFLTVLTWQWVRSKQQTFPWKLALTWFVTMLIWVNAHIFFIFGGVILGAAGLTLLLAKDWQRLQHVLTIGLVSLFGCLLNPLGLAGVLYPFQIFDNYAYRVAENQSIWFFLTYHPRPYYFYLGGLVMVVLLLTLLPLLTRKKLTNWMFPSLLVLVFGALTAVITRYESLFALSALFWFGSVGHQQTQQLLKKITEKLSNTAQLSLGSILGCILLIGWLTTANIIPTGMKYGLGLYPENRASAVFYRSLELEGEIFNNYDIGGFLIFELFPEQRVFVDNRPEAYPNLFMTNEFIAAQESETVWEEMTKKYDIGTIYFYRHDMTDFGQNFLIERINDERWIPIFVDDYALILIENRPAHAEIIEKYALPKEIFVVTQP